MKIVSAAYYAADAFQRNCLALIGSARQYDIAIDFYGIGERLPSLVHAKVNRLLDILDTLHEEVVCVCDSSDTIINNDMISLERVAKAAPIAETEIVISGERNCYPIEGLKIFYESKRYTYLYEFKYVNSGFIMGCRESIIKCLKRIIELSSTRTYPYADNDQFWWTYLFLFEDMRIGIDRDLCCLNLADVDLRTLNVSRFVSYLNKRPFLIHFNGPVKCRTEEYYRRLMLTDVESLIRIEKRFGTVGMSMLARFAKFDVWIMDHVFAFYQDLPYAANVIDIGGHCGYFACAYKARYPASNVFMYEPYEPNFRMAEKNFQLNGVSVHGYHGAVIGRETCRYIHVLEEHNLGRVVCNDKPSGISVTACFEINAVLDGKDDLIIKIDAEGAEWSILTSITEENWKRIKRIVGEWHPLEDSVKGQCREWEHFRPLLRDLAVSNPSGHYFTAERK